jgi:hypothetical protein
MNIRLFGCGKFKWMSIEKFDRQLTPKEEDFYRKHRDVCFECMRYEQQGLNAMNLLSAGSIEPEISEHFDENVLEGFRRSRKRVAFTYWSPVLAGAAVACLALMATLQLLSRSPMNVWQKSGAQGADNRFYNQDPAATSPNLVLSRELINR